MIYKVFNMQLWMVIFISFANARSISENIENERRRALLRAYSPIILKESSLVVINANSTVEKKRLEQKCRGQDIISNFYFDKDDNYF